MTDRYFSLEQLREAERLFASKRECSPAVNAIGRALLREYQLSLAECERLRAATNDLAEAVEQDAAEKAYAAGFGASEWAAFVPKKLYEALARSRAALGEADND